MHGRRGLLIAGIGVTTWVVGGALVYYAIGNCTTIRRERNDGTIDPEFLQCPWTFQQCFYFSVQAGLSIGFGLLQESKKASELYSCFHILLGSSIISGALAMFASLALARNQDFMGREERRLAKASRRIHADCYDGFSNSELCRLIATYPHYANAIIRRTYKDVAVAKGKIASFKGASKVARLKLASAILSDASTILPELKGGKITLKDMESIDHEAANVWARIRSGLRSNRGVVVSTLAFLSWIALGTVWSMAVDDNDFITGLYFAISTLSTAGMVSVNTVENQSHVLFAGFYALVGVQIYALFLSMFANVLVDRYNCKQFQDGLQHKMSQAEVEFLEHIAKNDHSPDVDFSEFLEFQLLRLGVIDRDMIDLIREQWEKFEKDGEGRLQKDTFLHEMERIQQARMHADRSLPPAPLAVGAERLGPQAADGASRVEASAKVEC